MATGNSAMELRTGSGWSRGLDTMLRGELRHWFGTRRWWVQILIWAAAVNLIFMMVAFSTKRLVDAGETAPGMGRLESLMIFNIFMGLAGPVGVCILMQGAVVREKRSGTAAWVLSKPASRTSFVLSKLLGNTAGVIVTMVVAQGIIAYLIAGLVLDLLSGHSEGAALDPGDPVGRARGPVGGGCIDRRGGGPAAVAALRDAGGVGRLCGGGSVGLPATGVVDEQVLTGG